MMVQLYRNDENRSNSASSPPESNLKYTHQDLEGCRHRPGHLSPRCALPARGRNPPNRPRIGEFDMATFRRGRTRFACPECDFGFGDGTREVRLRHPLHGQCTHLRETCEHCEFNVDDWRARSATSCVTSPPAIAREKLWTTEGPVGRIIPLSTFLHYI